MNSKAPLHTQINTEVFSRNYLIKSIDQTQESKTKTERLELQKESRKSTEAYVDWIISAIPPDFYVPAKHRFSTALLIENVYIGNANRHKNFHEATSISRKYFESIFRTDPEYIKRVKSSLLREPIEGSYSQKYGTTKAYQLHPEVELNVDRLLRKKSNMYYGIPKKSTCIKNTANRRSKKAGVKPLVPINLEYANECVPILQEWLNHYKHGGAMPLKLRVEIKTLLDEKKATPWVGSYKAFSENYMLCPEKRSPEERLALRLKQDLLALHSLIDQASYRDHPGKIRHSFTQKPCGRIYAKTVSQASSRVGLQACSGFVRDICFHGFYSYDIESFNHSVAQQIAMRHGLPYALLLKLITKKDAVRRYLAKKYRITVQQVKEFLTALMYGAATPRASIAYNAEQRVFANVKKSTGFALVDIVYAHQYVRLMSDPIVVGLAGEVKSVFNKILELFTESQSQPIKIVKNAAGMPLRWSKKEGDKRSLVAAFFQGIEYVAQQAMVKQIPSSIFTVHDAVIATESSDVDQLINAMLEATNYHFSLEKKQL